MMIAFPLAALQIRVEQNTTSDFTHASLASQYTLCIIVAERSKPVVSEPGR